MKRKIDTIKGKRLIVGGGTNNLTKDEILVETKGDTITLKERDDSGKIKQLSGSGGSSSSDMEYYKLIQTGVPYDLVALYKIKTATSINILGNNPEDDRQIVAIAYAPIVHEGIIYHSLKDYFQSQVPDMPDEEFENFFAGCATPITKEEFYDLNNI